jgi:hypothetical protein
VRCSVVRGVSGSRRGRSSYRKARRYKLTVTAVDGAGNSKTTHRTVRVLRRR